MKVEDFRRRRIFLAAHEAGGGSLLAALVRDWQPAPGSLGIVSTTAAPYFANGPLLVNPVMGSLALEEAIALIDATEPEWVVVGASTFASVEKTVMRAAVIAGKRVAAFVDHYWNLWQRFAHEDTAEKWYYKPDVIFVPAQSCLERIVQMGAPSERIHVFSHPLLEQAALGATQISREQVRGMFDLPETGSVVLFVSEYGFPQSAKWQWEQAQDGDLIGLLETVLQAAGEAADRGPGARTVLIKLHPAQMDFASDVLAKYPSSIYRVVRQCDKHDIFQISDLAIGLDSMLLLEASRAGVAAYSYHPSAVGKGRWLSDIHPEIMELNSATECARLIRGNLIAPSY